MPLTYPAARVSIPEARATLRPFISAAVHEGVGMNEFYLAHVTKTTVTMRREDFFPWANRIAAHVEKAVAPSLQDPNDPLVITQLAQERIPIPDRFWGRFEITREDSKKVRSTAWVTYGFNEKITIAELEDDAFDYAAEFAESKGQRVVDVRLTELYKQW